RVVGCVGWRGVSASSDEASASSSVACDRSGCTGTTKVPSSFRTMSMGHSPRGMDHVERADNRYLPTMVVADVRCRSRTITEGQKTSRRGRLSGAVRAPGLPAVGPGGQRGDRVTEVGGGGGQGVAFAG